MIVYLKIQIIEHFGQSKYRIILVSLAPHVLRKQVCLWTSMMPAHSVLSQFTYLSVTSFNYLNKSRSMDINPRGKKKRKCKLAA